SVALTSRSPLLRLRKNQRRAIPALRRDAPPLGVALRSMLLATPLHTPESRCGYGSSGTFQQVLKYSELTAGMAVSLPARLPARQGRRRRGAEARRARPGAAGSRLDGGEWRPYARCRMWSVRCGGLLAVR